jgi:hypothetical protein
MNKKSPEPETDRASKRISVQVWIRSRCLNVNRVLISTEPNRIVQEKVCDPNGIRTRATTLKG